MSEHLLHASTGGMLVGRLTYETREDHYRFDYAKSWVDSSDSFYLSPAIPLERAPESRGAVHRFLENLLPEGRALDIASIVNQVSKGNTFALIHALGKEPVGAFSFMAFDASEGEAARLVRAASPR